MNALTKALNKITKLGAARCLIGLIFIASGIAAQAQIQVSTMPSYTQSVSYGNAVLNEPIAVWGRTWGGTGAVTYVLDFGDGTAAQTGSVTDAKYIAGNHSYTTAGFKTVRLTVTDSTSATATRTSLLRVFASPTHEERVNMAIEKGLLYLYRNQIISGEKSSWGTNDEYGTGASGSTVLAFEENGHLPGNSRVEDIYSETVQRGLNNLVSIATTMAISNQTAGNPDTNGNNVGVWIGHQNYAHCFSLTAIIMGYPDLASAQAAIVPAGLGAMSGSSFHRVAVDMMDTLHYCQNDSPYLGWHYAVNTSGGTGNDGSINQWPNIAFTLAKERWGHVTPAWVIQRSVLAFQALQNVNGACGYSSNADWLNAAKTGGMITGYALGGKAIGDNDVDRGINFIGQRWLAATTNTTFASNEGWAGQWYGMYGVKKGLTISGVSTLSTPYGPRNWYRDMSAWLLGNGTLLDTPDPVNNPSNQTVAPGLRSTAHMYGQLSDGRWDSTNWPSSSSSSFPYSSLSTAHGILVLTKSVAVPVPVAVITAIPDQNLINPSFRVSGSASYHLDPEKSISQYLWDWDASNGVDWDNPDATGPNPLNPGYTTLGVKTISLRVVDNTDLVATTTATVAVVATDVAPIAVAIPQNLLPSYAGHAGQPIQLDGTSSYDPDLDAISSYSWDTNGDGTYGDATGPTPTVTFATAYTGQVGLRVTANGKTSTNVAMADIYASPNDFYIESITASNVVAGVSADIQVVIRNATGSTGAWNNVSVRFYNGDPLDNGSQVGGNYTVNLASEGTATLNLNLAGLVGFTQAYVYVDAAKVVPEWDERNNISSVYVGPNHPEMAVTGNGVEIVSGDATPSADDFTSFAAVNTSAASVTRVYTISNTGLGVLNLSGIAPNYVTLSGSADFTVSLQPTTPVAHTVGTTTFSVTFDPSSDGLKSAVVSIANNDQTENPYTFTVSGSGMTTPVITDEPDGGSYQVYDNVTLSVTATGTATLTYQWSRDGVPINGATSSQYIVAPLTREKAGSYTVVVTNDAGSDTSAPAVLIALNRELLRTDDDMVVPGFPVTDLYRPLSGVIGPNGGFVVNALATVGPGGITSGNDQVIITNVSGSLSAIGQESQSVGSGTLSRLFYYMNAPANGTAHYRAILNGGSAADDTAYFVSQDGQSLEILSREGDEAPEGGLTFSGHIAPPAISQSGIVYFDSKLLGPGVTAKNDTGVWFDNAGSQGTLVREGDRAPTGNSVADQAWFGQIMAGSVVAGEEAASFISDLQADPLNAANKTSGLRNTGVFTGVAGDVSLVVRKGDVIADLPIRGFNALAVSPDGGHAFVAHLTVGGPISTANSLALFYKPADGEPVFVAQKGQTLPDTGVINVFERFFAADDGQVIFEVTLTNMTSSDNALCRWTAADGIEVLMQEGDASPGGGVYGALRSLSVSGNGKVMIQDSRAVWRDVGAGMEMVVKVGDTVFYGGLPRTALSLAVNDEMANTRRAGGGFGGTINNDGSVLAIMSVGSGQYTTQIFP